MPRYSARFLAAPRPTLYARRTKGGPVELFSNPDGSAIFARYDMGHPRRPRHGRQWITLRNFRYKLEWLPDTTPTPDT